MGASEGGVGVGCGVRGRVKAAVKNQDAGGGRCWVPDMAGREES